MPKTLEEREEYLRNKLTYSEILPNGMPRPPVGMIKYISENSSNNNILGYGLPGEQSFLDSEFFPFLGLSAPAWIVFIVCLVGPALLFGGPIIAVVMAAGLSSFMKRLAIMGGIIYVIIWYFIVYYTVDKAIAAIFD